MTMPMTTVPVPPALITTVDIDPHMPDRIAVWSDFRLKDSIKEVPGARWSAEHRRWTVPLTWGSCLALRAELGRGLKIEPTLNAWAYETRALKNELIELRTVLEGDDSVLCVTTSSDDAKPVDELVGFGGLFPFQLVGARLIELAERYLLFDETGAGKSRTALAGLKRVAAKGEDVFPLLVVAPKSMLRTWQREVLRFFPELDDDPTAVRVVQGTPAVVRRLLEPGGYVYVCSYDTARRYSRLAPYPTVKLTDDEKRDKELNAIGWQSMITDEVHRAKNPASKQTRALWHLGEQCRFKVGLTGTPIQDTPEDMWSVLRFVVPEEYPTKSSYVDRFLEVKLNRWGAREIGGLNLAHETELNANLHARYRRLTKEVATPWLPPKMFELRWVELPPKLRKAYNDMAAKMVSGTVVAGSTLEKAGRLIQLANATLETTTPPGPLIPPVVKMVLPSPKIDAFIEDINAGDYDGQSVVVYSDSRQLADLLEEVMIKNSYDVVKITGGVVGDARQEAIDRFQDGSCKFIIITRAGGEGITLTKASCLVRLVRSWSGIAHAQSEDRVHRIGSEAHAAIRIVDYVTEDTVEEGQFVRLTAKKTRAQEVLRDADLLEAIKIRIMATEAVE